MRRSISSRDRSGAAVALDGRQISVRPSIAGSTSQSSGVFTINAGGIDTWDAADQFHFVYQRVTGDVEVIARVTIADRRRAAVVRRRCHDPSLAGRQFRARICGRHEPTNGVYFRRRLSNGALTTSVVGIQVAPPDLGALSCDGVPW